jgi:hypothetical protein
MAIAKKPKRNTGASQAVPDERAAEAFISAAGKPEPVETANARLTPVMFRFDRPMLGRIDEAAKRRGVTRSAWVKFIISRALESGDN